MESAESLICLRMDSVNISLYSSVFDNSNKTASKT